MERVVRRLGSSHRLTEDSKPVIQSGGVHGVAEGAGKGKGRGRD